MGNAASAGKRGLALSGPGRAAAGARFELTEALAADGVDFELHRDGLLVAAESEHAAQTFLRGLAPLRALGYRIPDAPSTARPCARWSPPCRSACSPAC